MRTGKRMDQRKTGGRWGPPVCILCRFFLPAGLLPLMRVEQRLADADILRGHLDHLVVVDIGYRLFQRDALRRGQADRVVLARRTAVRELLRLHGVDLEVVGVAFVAYDHALIQPLPGRDETEAAIL